MTPILFTHANTLREVFVTKEQVFAIQYSLAHKCTHLISTNGAILPIAESVQDAASKIYNTIQKGAENGTKSNNSQ